MNKKSITIRDIAKRAGVSKATVSRVLNENTPVNDEKKQRVLSAMKELDYKPNRAAQNLAKGSSMTLGVVTQQIGSPFYDQVTQGVIQALSGSSYSPIFSDGQWEAAKERRVIQTFLDRFVDGLIVIGGTLSSEELTRFSEARPMVLVARSLAGWEDRCIAIDNVAASRDATRYLIDAGHRRIAHLRGIESHQDAIDRYLGYQQALSEAGIELDDRLVELGDFEGEAGKQATAKLLDSGVKFTAIFASNDEMAYGARLELYERGIQVPDEISIVGFDDQPNSEFMTPPLTTVEQPAFDMGVEGVATLLAILRGEKRTINELSANLVERSSVKQFVSP